MVPERHKATAHRFYDEAFNKGYLNILDELRSPEIVAHDALSQGCPTVVRSRTSRQSPCFVPPSPICASDVSTDLCREQAVRIVEALPGGFPPPGERRGDRRTGGILEVVLALARGWGPVPVTLQANLKRTPRDAERLAEALPGGQSKENHFT